MITSGTCPTVRVVSPESPGGFKIINESDLAPEHELWTDADPERVKAAVNDGAAKRDRHRQ